MAKMRELLRGRRAPFQVLIVSERKSLGREQAETPYLLKQLDKAGVDVVEYVHGKSLIARTPEAAFLATAQGFSDADQITKASERVTVVHTRLAKNGKVTGGRVFGYRNVDIFNGLDSHGRPLKSHTEREIVPAEAKVVTQIFEWYASGLGLKAIAKKANQMDLLAPKPFIRKSDKIPTPIGKWAPSTIRTILGREIYKGVVVYNKTKKRNAYGEVDPRPRPESEWIRTPVKDLEIVSPKLWDRVAARRKEVDGHALRFEGGRMSGRPPKGEARNLLAGLGQCGICGGGIVVETSPRKRGRVPEYVCHRRRHYGTCSNEVHVRVDHVNEQILCAIEEHALTAEAIEQVIRLSERDDVREKHEALQREQQDCARRIERLTSVIADGGDASSLVAKLRELETRHKAIDTEIRCLRPVPRLAPQVVEGRLAEWRRLLRQSVTQGRAVLQRVLRGRIVFTPREGGGYDYRCETRYDKLFSGVAVERPSFLPSGTGFVPQISAEDTWDSDYGRILEDASRKRDGVPGASQLEPDRPMAPPDRRASGSVKAWATMEPQDRHG